MEAAGRREDVDAIILNDRGIAMRRTVVAFLAAALALPIPALMLSAQAQSPAGNAIPVIVDNFVRAESDLYSAPLRSRTAAPLRSRTAAPFRSSSAAATARSRIAC